MRTLGSALLLSLSACHSASHPIDVAERIGAGQVRAGRITSTAALVGGPHSGARIGDYKIYNSRVRFVVSDVGPAVDGYDPYGGGLVAADRVRAAGEADQSTFGQIIPCLAGRTGRPTRVDVLSDGSDGAAHLRVTGPDDVLPLLEALKLSNAQPLNADVTFDYTLKPDADYLIIDVGLVNHGTEPMIVGENWLGYVMGHSARSYLPGYGFDVPFAPQAVNFYAAATDRVSYSFFAPSTSFTPIIGYQGLLIADYGPLNVLPGKSARYRVYFVVGDGDLAFHARTHEILAAHDGVPLGDAHARGVVVDETGHPLASARVHAAGAKGDEIMESRSAADGSFDVPLPPGHYTLTAVADGRDPGVPVPVDLSGQDATAISLALGPAGSLALAAVDSSGAGLPVKFLVRRSGAPRLKTSFGEDDFVSDVARTVYATDGHAQLALSPATYHVTVSRGVEYDLVEGDVTVATSASFSATLHQVVDTKDWLSGDFHLHALWSADSNDTYELKVAAFAGEGLEVPVTTEHEYIGDYTPTVKALGLTSYIHPIVGEEISTNSLGHFNAFPLVADPRAWNAGGFAWVGVSIPDLFATIRKAAPKAVLQVNHPRYKAYAYFLAANLADGTSANPEWTTNFDALELANGPSINEVWDDWIALTNRGMRVTATGDSDSHHALQSEVGPVRNYVHVASDDPSAFAESDFVDSVRAGHLTISAGPVIFVTAAGAGPGDLVPASNETVRVHLKVQAAPWLGPLDRAVIFLAGVEVAHVDLASAPSDKALRYEGDIDVPVAHDAALIVRVDGGDLSKVYPNSGKGFAVANPLYVDANGDGQFHP